MKRANIELKLSKDHSVHKSNVTPLEAMILTAEHHKNAGGDPITVDEASVSETGTDVEVPGPEVDHDTIEVGADGKKFVKTVKQPSKVKKFVADNRTDDSELNRLRGIYGRAKVNYVASQVRDFPKDFKSASQKGVEISLPSGGLTNPTKII